MKDSGCSTVKVRFLSTILLIFICYLTANAQAVYVDSNTGSDSNDGRQDTPFFSIHKATEILDLSYS